MANGFGSLYIGASGVQNAQSALNTTANNLANVDTKGYVRQQVRFADKNYTTLNSWNTSGSLSSKAYKCGINKISNGVELCWGISNYGSNTYTVKYTITNFVSSLADCQMVYWTLIPYDFSNSIGSVKIKIH